MHNWSDPASAAQAILARPASVLLADACALLDVRRAPVRSNMQGVAVSGAKALLARAASGAGAPWFVAANLVVAEYERHAQESTNELERTLRTATAYVAAARESAQHVLAAPAAPVIDYCALGLHEALEIRAEALVGKLDVVSTDDLVCHTRAFRRTAMSEAPASPGKPEIADCAIIEHYLALAGSLRVGGLTNPIVFVSSNTADYGSPKKIRSPLDKEFANLGITFATDLAWANSIL